MLTTSESQESQQHQLGREGTKLAHRERHRSLSPEASVTHFMVDALAEAKEALKRGEVPVGCLFIRNGTIIASGGNEVNDTKNATRHAEMICIDKILQTAKDEDEDFRSVFPEISVVVTVEPCIMCLSALNQLKVREIIFGCVNDRFGGSTVLDVTQLLPPEERTPCKGGVRADEAMELLKTFYSGENPSAPVPKTRKTNKLSSK
ncbi:tRNA-specific adenosine deaminase 2 [Lutzomyia longipalpis]|uniref:tRNA-specific adenosine deaminase 2 n=1 Tax=Lutzomyia longipalpis TaxID=7200 RepID=UPI00248430F7|nr:tRNA-specific adenosine deaminase 2 [Lutzomyia longipalpis]